MVVGMFVAGTALGTRVERVIRKTLAGLGVLLVVFHGWLFAGQLWDGELADLGLIARWLVAAGLLLGLREIRKRGLSIVRSRSAIAIWVLAALLHGPALVERVGVTAPAIPDVVASLAPVAASAVVGGLLLLLALVLSAGRRAARLNLASFVTGAGGFDPFALDSYPILAARPPPVV